MKVLIIGDVTSPAGLLHLKNNLWRVRRERGIELCIVNGENASFITGIGAEAAEELLRHGADVITGGNHTLQNKLCYGYLEDEAAILRPINFGDGAPGRGYTVVESGGGYRALVINALGCVHIEPTLDSPYPYIDRALADREGKYDIAILDIHAEATGEKLAMGYAYDGKIQIIFGTHTHVQTADGQILPHGTGYITDVGMCGEGGGVLGMDAECVIARMRTRLPHKFKAACGAPIANAVIFDYDTTTRRVTKVESFNF